MNRDHWATILTRISPTAPINLDEGVFEQGNVSGQVLAANAAGPLPSVVLWARGEPTFSYIGIRMREPVADCADVAVRLAGAAVERGVVPVILTTLPTCGFERFGFRVERIAGADAAELARSEQEIARFWNLAITIDIADMVAFG
jgi:hypothetical protein